MLSLQEYLNALLTSHLAYLGLGKIKVILSSSNKILARNADELFALANKDRYIVEKVNTLEDELGAIISVVAI